MIKSMARDPPPPEHKKTTGFTAANTNVALLEAFRILAGPEQLAVLSNIVLTEAGVVAKQVLILLPLSSYRAESSVQRQSL